MADAAPSGEWRREVTRGSATSVQPSKPFVCWPISLQMPGRPTTLDRSRTALAAAAYVRRDRFERGSGQVVDFTKRGSDLVARAAILPNNVPDWAQSPYLRWALADEASDQTGNPEDIRAWHVVADLPAAASYGEWVDRVTELVWLALTPTAVADVAIHDPGEGIPAHAHVVAASRIPGAGSYLGVDYDLYSALNIALRVSWNEWLQESGHWGD